MRNSQRFAKCSHLWPSSVFKRTPVAGFQIITVLSVLPLAMLPSIDQATARTGPLPFLNMSSTALRLCPAAGLNTNAKCSHLWPFRHKIFAPVCAQMRWMRPSPAPAAMTWPASGPILHAPNFRVKARLFPSSRSVVVVPQHEIHDVGVLGE
jgi:hypothetical protein